MIADQNIFFPEKVGLSVLLLAVLVLVATLVIWRVTKHIAGLIRVVSQRTSTLEPNGGSSVADQVASTQSMTRGQSQAIDSILSTQHVIVDSLNRIDRRLNAVDDRLLAGDEMFVTIRDEHSRLGAKIDDLRRHMARGMPTIET